MKYNGRKQTTQLSAMERAHECYRRRQVAMYADGFADFPTYIYHLLKTGGISLFEAQDICAYCKPVGLSFTTIYEVWKSR